MSKQANKRLQKEYASLAKAPPPFVLARPYESNLLECHFIMRGPDDSPYAGGEYHGVLLFTANYPFAPPGIKMFTPSGRFQPDRKICSSFSDFHPGSWNPAWSVSTILTGLLSFMLSDEITTGSVRTTDAEKRIFAKQSHEWNCKNVKFKTIFPDYATPGEMKRLPNMGEQDLGKPDGPPLPKNLGGGEQFSTEAGASSQTPGAASPSAAQAGSASG
ncbi:UBC-like protein [Cystobasidium minutum MCA 4210]|uniref:UBC-like protein n=1 Tax=Cystobasidium minutum MCA 4210 TaxID=1397322 RepID=UPI0034CE79D1|eukprot:jgi/Rhomi1/154345/estExt_Genewise1.C_5_t20406